MTENNKNKSLPSSILKVLKEARNPLLAREIADMLSNQGFPEIDKKQINSCLYRELKGKVKQNKSYRWSQVSPSRRQDSKTSSAKSSEEERSTIDKDRRSAKWKKFVDIIDYYIDCIREDDHPESSYFLSGEGTDFISLPLISEWSLIENNSMEISLSGPLSGFALQIRKLGSRGALYYGYPLYVHWIERSKRGWSGGIAIPLFLQSVEYDLRGQDLSLQLIHEWPRVNAKFLSSIFSSQEEQRHFIDELGLLEAEGDPPDEGLTDIVRRMVDQGLPAEALESLDPNQIPKDPSVRELTSSGLYNRPLLVIGERSKFTAGLEKELEHIRNSVPDNQLGQSALRLFFGSKRDHRKVNSLDSQNEDFIEVVPLNDEQRMAMKSAFENPLTVITGPPGTGKSQVVTTVLANAYLRGQRVLFTSRNHKAVDVVQERIKDLSGFQLAIRTGTKSKDRDFRAELIEFLTQVMSISVTNEDREFESEAQKTFDKLQKCRDKIWKQIDKIRNGRNLLDHLDRNLENSRKCLPKEIWNRVFNINVLPDEAPVDKALSIVKLYLADNLNILKRIGLWLKRRSNFKAIVQHTKYLSKWENIFNCSPGDSITKENLKQWNDYLEKTIYLIEVAKKVVSYRKTLQRLKKKPSFENLTYELSEIEDKLWECSANLLVGMGRLLPDKLRNASLRRAFGEFQATMKRLSGDQLGGRIYARLMEGQKNLFKTISEVLPVWCVTNLSVRSVLPFENGIFDLVVIDEASQCDIPSAIPLFYRAKHAVIIGDPHQLRHISTLERHRAQQLEAKYSLDSTADQPYTYGNNSLFDLSVTCLGQAKVVTLREHFRSHADIINFSNKHWYRDILRICTDYRKLRGQRHDKPAIVWTTVKGKAISPAGGGALNQAEAEAVVSELKKLLIQRKFPGTVGVVTPFRKHANRIWDLVIQQLDLQSIERAALIVDTAHGFQGDERDIIIFSPCITHDLPRGPKYFLSKTGNLFNVAITRARSLLHVIGDHDACANCGIPHIEAFATYVSNLGSDETQKGETYFNPDDPRVGHWEKPFYEALKAAGLKPISQYHVNQYRLDFALIDGDIRFDIEIDGELYHKEWDGTRCREDVIRDIRLTALGWNVKRFWVYQIRDDMDDCVKEVLAALGEAQKNSNH